MIGSGDNPATFPRDVCLYIIASSGLVALVDQLQPMVECTKVYYAYIWGHEDIPRRINSARDARWLVYRGHLLFV